MCEVGARVGFGSVRWGQGWGLGVWGGGKGGVWVCEVGARVGFGCVRWGLGWGLGV